MLSDGLVRERPSDVAKVSVNKCILSLSESSLKGPGAERKNQD